MIIDVILAVLLLLALIKGWRKGLVMAVFSLLAFVIGLAAALKLSAVTAVYLGHQVNVSARWLPVLSFLLVFLLVALLVNWSGRFVEQVLDLASLGWINKLGGILLYAVLYILLYSVALFYLVQLQLLKQDSIAASKTYALIEPWGPACINGLGKFIPFFQHLFDSLRDFFGNMGQKLS